MKVNGIYGCLKTLYRKAIFTNTLKNNDVSTKHKSTEKRHTHLLKCSNKKGDVVVKIYVSGKTELFSAIKRVLNGGCLFINIEVLTEGGADTTYG